MKSIRTLLPSILVFLVLACPDLAASFEHDGEVVVINNSSHTILSSIVYYQTPETSKPIPKGGQHVFHIWMQGGLAYQMLTFLPPEQYPDVTDDIWYIAIDPPFSKAFEFVHQNENKMLKTSYEVISEYRIVFTVEDKK